MTLTFSGKLAAIFLAELWGGGLAVRCWAALALTGGVAALERWLTPQIAAPSFYLLLAAAVGSAGVFGGGAPGVIATIAGVALGAGLGAHLGQPAIETVYQGGAFALLGLGASWAGQRRRDLVHGRRQTDGEIRAREEQLRSILEASPDAVVMIDGFGAIRLFSRAAETMFGYARDEAVGRDVGLLVPEAFRAQHATLVKSFHGDGGRHTIGVGRTLMGRRRDGSAFPVEITISEMRAGSRRDLVGFIRDLSEQQAAHRRLHELQEQLVHVSRLTELGEMNSALAHELNQPLSAIANYLNGAHKLLAGETSEAAMQASAAVEKAAHQAVRSGEVIRRIRGFVARGRVTREAQSVSRLVDEACALGLIGAGDLALRVELDLDPAAAAVLADRVEIEQVLVNLIRNAVDAMARAPRRVLSISARPIGGDMAEIRVGDTGPGLDPEVAQRLFQPFVTTKPNGVGVGLSICRTIVEAHGGRIWSQAGPAGGAQFCFTLPLGAPA